MNAAASAESASTPKPPMITLMNARFIALHMMYERMAPEDVGLLGSARHAMRLFSHSRLRRMALTGMRIDGAELYRLGIVEACVPPEELMPKALEIARSIAS